MGVIIIDELSRRKDNCQGALDTWHSPSNADFDFVGAKIYRTKNRRILGDESFSELGYRAMQLPRAIT